MTGPSCCLVVCCCLALPRRWLASAILTHRQSVSAQRASQDIDGKLLGHSFGNDRTVPAPPLVTVWLALE
jgi:hypothetical protein